MKNLAILSALITLSACDVSQLQSKSAASSEALMANQMSFCVDQAKFTCDESTKDDYGNLRMNCHPIGDVSLAAYAQDVDATSLAGYMTREGVADPFPRLQLIAANLGGPNNTTIPTLQIIDLDPDLISLQGVCQ